MPDFQTRTIQGYLILETLQQEGSAQSALQPRQRSRLNKHLVTKVKAYRTIFFLEVNKILMDDFAFLKTM